MGYNISRLREALARERRVLVRAARTSDKSSARRQSPGSASHPSMPERTKAGAKRRRWKLPQPGLNRKALQRSSKKNRNKVLGAKKKAYMVRTTNPFGRKIRARLWA